MERILTIIFLLVLGAVSFLFSFLLGTVLLLFIGLGLIVWGTALIFISSTKLIKVDLIVPQLNNYLFTIDNLLKSLNAEDTSYFLPPAMPGANPVQIITISNPQRSEISLVPSGLNLEWQFEKKSKIDFSAADLEYLKEFLPMMFVDELGLATDLEMSSDNNVVHVKMRNFVLHELCESVHKTDDQICRRTPCPVCSAISCALTKVTRKAISVEKTSLLNDDLEIWFRIFEPAPE